MKRIIRNAIALMLAMVTVASVLTVSAFAKSDKSDKAHKADKGSPSTVCGSAAVITLDQAKEIALADAGVDGASAVFSKEKLDKAVYELKFSVPGGKYEYEVSAASGVILSCEYEGKAPSHTPAPGYEAAVSPEQARQIALDAAGLSAENLKYVICYVSWANHAPYAYEVEFSTRTASYHYTIDLNSGAVLGNSSRPRR